MKTKNSLRSKNTKFVRIDNSTWIETHVWIPDDVARIQFLQKVMLAKQSPLTDPNQTKTMFA
jgi:hypothetical protein